LGARGRRLARGLSFEAAPAPAAYANRVGPARRRRVWRRRSRPLRDRVADRLDHDLPQRLSDLHRSRPFLVPSMGSHHASAPTARRRAPRWRAGTPDPRVGHPVGGMTVASDQEARPRRLGWRVSFRILLLLATAVSLYPLFP